ncbi:meiosis-specific protein ASY3-like [Rutidosis leptorrhynchoides]|uniref:meiosis-specific protein ASY3-like n=1 Tax=Rutidosis leptorrhynchoides TaxID=125765 RepID=UPI003A9940E1
MSATKSSSRKKKITESGTPKTELKRVMVEEDNDDFNFDANQLKHRVPKKKRSAFEDDFDADLSSDIKGLMSALHQIKEKAQKDGQKKKDETISSVATEIRSKFDDLKSKVEKERQNFAKALSKSSKECENLLKNETAKFQTLYENFSKDKNAHLQALKDTISKYEEDKERLFLRYEQQRKKEKNMLSEHEKACATKIAELEESLKKKKQDDKTFSILRKTLGSFLDNASDEDFPADDD